MKNIKIEIHLLQNFPPSCLNRDDTNTPKTCDFGGVNRARVSSQCWKRAVREHFQERAPERRGTRSKRLKAELIKRLIDDGAAASESINKAVEAFVVNFYAAMDKKRPDETNVLVFFSPAEFEEIVAILKEPGVLADFGEEKPDLRRANEFKNRLKACKRSADVALFGRMLADNPDMNGGDAACQVAHAISTHAVNLELDFFTAVDDLKSRDAQDDAGAAMLGTVGYDSACYYRYALVDYAQLVQNLNGSAEDADDALATFLTAFCESVPGAKKNSFAHGNPPFLAFFVVRDNGTPASLVNAFARPVNTRSGDLLKGSAAALANQASLFETKYDLYEGTKCFFFQALSDPLTLPGVEIHKFNEARTETVAAVRAIREGAA